jgi:hypothetical protein
MAGITAATSMEKANEAERIALIIDLLTMKPRRCAAFGTRR